LILIQLVTSGQGVVLSEVPECCYAKAGDINLALLQTVHGSSADNYCGPIEGFNQFQEVESMIFAINEINANPNILPNISLGYVVMDTCSRDLTALARAVHLMRGSVHINPGDVTNCSAGTPQFNIVGMVGPAYSSTSLMVAPYLGLHQIPMIGTNPTSDTLSDKSRFEYF